MTGDTFVEPAPWQAPALPWTQWEAAPLWRGPRVEIVVRCLAALVVLGCAVSMVWSFLAAPRYVDDQRAVLGDAAAGRLVRVDAATAYSDPHLPDRARRLDPDPPMLRWQTKDGYYQTIKPRYGVADEVRVQPYVVAHPDSVTYGAVDPGGAAGGFGPYVSMIALLSAVFLLEAPQPRLMPKWAWGLSFLTVVGLAAWLLLGGSTQRARPVPVRRSQAGWWVVGTALAALLLVTQTTVGTPLRGILNPPYRGGGPYVAVTP